MLHYKNTTFCTGAGCATFDRCPFALTAAIKEAAIQWWGNVDAPLSQYADPTCLECYVPPAGTPTGKVLLLEEK